MTKQGVAALIAGIAAIATGRVFGVVELFVIGAGFLLAVLLGVLYVRVRRPAVTATRWIHPSVLVAGETGSVDLALNQRGTLRTPRFEIAERVRQPGLGEHVAALTVAPLAPRSASSARYQVPTSRRGIVSVGPLVATVTDALGIARSRRVIAERDEITVAPRAYLLDLPELGQGVLGRHLLTQARRLGPGEFHSLRDYVDGDEPRTISWKASARSENLVVKQFTIEGLRHCTVVLDAAEETYDDEDAFERAITAAASLVNSADHAGLTTRFVTDGGVDLRGPDVTPNTLRVLARISPAPASGLHIERDTADGLGLLAVVTGSTAGAAWRTSTAAADPTTTPLPVTTVHPASNTLAVSARTEEEFLDSWRSLIGQGRLDTLRQRPTVRR